MNNDYYSFAGQDSGIITILFIYRGREYGLHLSRPPPIQARYKMIRHHKAWRSLHNIGLLCNYYYITLYHYNHYNYYNIVRVKLKQIVNITIDRFVLINKPRIMYIIN